MSIVDTIPDKEYFGVRRATQTYLYAQHAVKYRASAGYSFQDKDEEREDPPFLSLLLTVADADMDLYFRLDQWDDLITKMIDARKQFIAELQEERGEERGGVTFSQDDFVKPFAQGLDCLLAAADSAELKEEDQQALTEHFDALNELFEPYLPADEESGA